MPETFTTYAELVEFIETQSAEIIQGPWTQELADAAKNLPTNGETADIISIVKQGTTATGTATGAVALTGQSVASGGTGLYSAIGAFTSVGLTVAIAAGATALGVSIGYVAGQKLYEANPQLWARISDAVLPACLKFESGSEPAQPQVPMIIGADGKSYLPKAFMDLLKNALIDLNMAVIDEMSPLANEPGTLTLNNLDIITNNYPNILNKLISMSSNAYNGDMVDKINTHIKALINNCQALLDSEVGEYKIVSASVYCNYDYESVYPEDVGTYNVQVAIDFITSIDYSKVVNFPFNIIEQQPASVVYNSSGEYLISSNNATDCFYSSIYSDISYNADSGEYTEDTGWGSVAAFGGKIFSEFWNNILMIVSSYSTAMFQATVTNLGNWINNRPDGVSITDGAVLPNTDTPIDIQYPKWKPNWINVTKPPTVPGFEPNEQEPYIPVEIPPIEPEVGTSTQDDGQGGDISTIPQEIPIITGLPEIVTIVNPTPVPPTPPQPNPDPDPIPDPSPQPTPEPPPTPSPTPSPQPIPEPPPIPSPQPQPEPEPEPPAPPQPQPQPEPVPPTPPIPPTDIGTDPPIVLPPIDPDNGIGAVYRPSRTQLRDLSAFLWSTDFIDQIKKLFQSPVDAIISLHQLYVNPSVGNNENIYLGYLDSEVTAPVVTNQFVTLDCGTVSVPSKYNNATDYSPYTSVSIYLPFVGIRELNADDVIGGTVNVTYRVDVLSGACLASVKCVRGTLNAVLYCFEGNCAVQLPVSGSTFGGPMAGMMVAGAVALGTALTAGAGASAATIATKAGLGAAGGMIAGSKTSIQKSGNFAGNAGALGSKKPYIIITRPIPCDASLFNHFYGFPANVTVQLNTLTGFTRVSSVHVQDVSSATDDEKRMIEEILKSGFIV